MRLQIPRNPRAERPDASGNTAIGKDSFAKRVRTTRLLTARMVGDCLGKRTRRMLMSGLHCQSLPNISAFNPDEHAEQLVLAITLVDGFDGVIFPLRVRLVAPTKT